MGHAFSSTKKQNENETFETPPLVRSLVSKHELETWTLLTKKSTSRLTLPLWGLILLVLLGTQLLFAYFPDRAGAMRRPCDVNNSWSSGEQIFQVTLRTGKLSFRNAKMIDVVYDLVGGRGGQLCLAWIAYRAHTDSMLYLAEKEGIDYKFLTTVLLYDSSFPTFVSAVKSIFSKLTPTTRLVLLWLILSVSYILAFPTLISTSTSYVTANNRLISLDDGTTAPAEDFVVTATYKLSNTGLSDVPSPWYLNMFSVDDAPTELENCTSYLIKKLHGQFSVNGTGYILSDDAVVQCGFNYNSHWYDFDYGPSAWSYVSDSRILCIPDKHNYQWGASWEMLVIILILQTCWGFTTLGMWAYVLAHSPLVGTGRKMGMWRTLLDITAPLAEKMPENSSVWAESRVLKVVEQLGPMKYSVEYGNGGRLRKVNVVSDRASSKGSKTTDVEASGLLAVRVPDGSLDVSFRTAEM